MDNRTEAPPKLFLHCSAVFEKMKTQSKPRQVEGGHALVYEGFLTKLICEDLGLATPYYTSVMHYLKQMGCVRQLARGGGPTPSLWELMHEPDIEAFERVEETKKKPNTWREGVDDNQRLILQRIDTLEQQVAILLEEAAS
jgi:hypothetical protein